MGTDLLVRGLVVIHIAHSLEKIMPTNSEKLAAALERLTTSVATEMRQLADAISAGDTPVAAAADAINALADKLDSDDPAAPTPTPTPSTP